MNRKTYLIILLLTGRICMAQNLVPNGDFEGYSGCPNDVSQFDSTLSWFNPTDGTPDYFNQCSNPNINVGVPNNGFGFQYAHSGGGYAGLYQVSSGNWHEYIEVPLISPLIAGACYQFEMFINGANGAIMRTYEIGVYFSDTAYYNLLTVDELPLVPQIANASGNYPDTILWKSISGNYTALGGESHLIIENFKNGANTAAISSNPNGWHIGTYVYIDDVCLTPCGSSCTIGLNDPIETVSINVYPNPFTDELKIKVSTIELSEIILYDIASRKLLQQKFTNSVSLNTEQLTMGLYIYEVRNKDGVIKKGKVVKD